MIFKCLSNRGIVLCKVFERDLSLTVAGEILVRIVQVDIGDLCSEL